MGLCAAATSIIIGLHTVSYHSYTAAGYNNNNLGMYGEYNSYSVGTYKNSLNHQSFYVGKRYELTDDCRYDLTLGGITGYNMAVMPVLIPGVKFDTSDVVSSSVARLQVMPTAQSGIKTNGFVVHLSLEKRF